MSNEALIIIHASAFYRKTKEIEANNKLINFIDSIKDEKLKILVYTRGLPEHPNEELKKRWNNILVTLDKPELLSKSKLHVMKKGHKSCFKDPEIGVPFKNEIKAMLKS